MFIRNLICTISLTVLTMHAAAQNPPEPFVISLGIKNPDPENSAGGIIAAELENDGKMGFLVTWPKFVGAYAADGRKLWTSNDDIRVAGKSEANGMPGHHGPGIQAYDIDGDGRTEVLYLDFDNQLIVRDGQRGELRWQAKLPPAPIEGRHWEFCAVANFRGEGDRDLLLQTTTSDDYRLGRDLAAFSIEALRSQQAEAEALWTTDHYLGCNHTPVRLADINGDGRDEVIGGTLFGPDGELLFQLADFPVRHTKNPQWFTHLDALIVGDVRPELPGLEVIGLEEGEDNRVFLFNADGLIWQTHHRNREPQNSALGRFQVGDPSAYLWCRSRFNEKQEPFTFNAQGEVVNTYHMLEVAPKDWTLRGIERIETIDWTGEERQYVAGKERHRAGDVCIYDGISGEFILRIPEKAERLLVADVRGDWREELVVLGGGEIRIYENPAENPRPDQPRLWEKNHYLRSKQTYNYYCP